MIAATAIYLQFPILTADKGFEKIEEVDLILIEIQSVKLKLKKKALYSFFKKKSCIYLKQDLFLKKSKIIILEYAKPDLDKFYLHVSTSVYWLQK